MHRLIIEVGWPGLIVCAALIVLAVPTLVPALVRWVRFERDLARRARRYEERMEAARVARIRIP
jgi:hypothetical protein